MYPVDLPAVDDTDLTSAAQQYISSLESRPNNNEWFISPHASKDGETSADVFGSGSRARKRIRVAITANNVRRLQMFEDDQPGCAVVALHSPDDPAQVVALYLFDKWWSVEDILQTSNKSRSGLMLVQSIVERVIVLLLSQVVERSTQEKVQFSLHPRTESCKLLWRDGRAVGFYTVKHKGSLCDSWSSRCYLLSVLDTVLVRSSWRRRGLGFQMLHDFCSWFSTEKFLGVSSPLSPSMVAVCRKFLQQHEENRERLYEVEAPGGWTQRRNIWLNIQLGRFFLDINGESSPTLGDVVRNEISNTTEEGSCEQILNIQAEEQAPRGCSHAAPTNVLDHGTPTRPSQSLNTKKAQKFKPTLCTRSPRQHEEVEDNNTTRAKRQRRT